MNKYSITTKVACWKQVAGLHGTHIFAVGCKWDLDGRTGKQTILGGVFGEPMRWGIPTHFGAT
jgi:hypothetical protein